MTMRNQSVNSVNSWGEYIEKFLPGLASTLNKSYETDISSSSEEAGRMAIEKTVQSLSGASQNHA